MSTSKAVCVVIIIFLITLLGICFFSKQTAKNGIKTNINLGGSHPMINVISPQPGEKITSPLIIKGEARGGWYFEAVFPVELTDWEGNTIAKGLATAKGDWMTSEFVPFEASLEFEKPAGKKSGTLILRRDNPSGLPENEDKFEVQVAFK